MAHRYKIQVEHVLDAHGNALTGRTVQFEVENHDDFLEIIERVREKGVLPEAEIAAFAVGLKVLGGVVIKHRGEDLFSEFAQGLARFIKKLKQTGGAG